MFMEGDWAYCHGSADLPSALRLHINDKETLAVVLAACRWAPLWQNSTVNIFTDNITTRAATRKGHSKNRAMMPYLRYLYDLSAIFNFKMNVFHISGVNNVVADAISRLSLTGYMLSSPFTPATPVIFCHQLPNHMSNAAITSFLLQIQQL